MARRLFFVDEIARGRGELRGEGAQHLTRVLRVEPGQKYEISDNQSLWLAEVKSARKDLVEFSLIERLERDEPHGHVTLYQALVKFDRFEWVLEKATELGVREIVPVVAERTEHGLEKAVHKRMDRWQRIVLESSQQSRRAVMPALAMPVQFGEVAKVAAAARLMCDEEPGLPPILSALPALRNSEDHVALLIGPEGGWVEPERRLAREAGWTGVSLGSHVLRAETAATAAVAIVNAAWQRPS